MVSCFFINMIFSIQIYAIQTERHTVTTNKYYFCNMKIITVTAAVIQKGKYYLLARRKAGNTPRSGQWEFPGGKLEPDESLQQCIKRELKEELCIDAEVGNKIIEKAHHYPDKSIKLIAFKIIHFEGEIHLSSHQEYDWVRPQAMNKYNISEADRFIVEYLQKKHPEE